VADSSFLLEDIPCRTVDPNIFFPDIPGDWHKAKKVCGTCPVQQQCLDWAVQVGEIGNGIFGGAGADRRRRLRREYEKVNGLRRQGKRRTAPHGTEARAKKHRRDGEELCEACREAAVIARRERDYAQRVRVGNG